VNILDYEGVERAMAKVNVTHEQAIRSLRNWWSGLFMAYDLNRQALITECQLIYVPFWKLRAKVTGRVVGYAYAIEEDIELDVKIDQTYLWTGIACDIREFGVDYLRNPEIVTEPYDPHLGSIADLTIPMKNAMADGRSWIEYAALKNVDVPNINFKRINVQPLEVLLIFYPLWTIKYSYYKQKYRATVDGVTGEILAQNVAPGCLFQWHPTAHLFQSQGCI
jgi:hypothetical protein